MLRQGNRGIKSQEGKDSGTPSQLRVLVSRFEDFLRRRELVNTTSFARRPVFQLCY